jgi:hypothetical protein
VPPWYVVGGRLVTITTLSMHAEASLFAWPTPDNDKFANARDLGSVTSGNNTFVIGGATRELLEDYPADHRTVWFKWTAPASGTVSFDTAATPPPRWDSAMRLLRMPSGGTVMADLVLLDEQDDNALQPGVTTPDGYGTTLVSSAVTAGDVLYVQVDSYTYTEEPSTGDPSAGFPRANCVLTWSLV